MNITNLKTNVLRKIYRLIRIILLRLPKLIYRRYQIILNFQKLKNLKRKERINIAFVFEVEATFFFESLIRVLLEDNRFNIYLINTGGEVEKIIRNQLYSNTTLVTKDNYIESDLFIDILFSSTITWYSSDSEYSNFLKRLYKKSILFYHPYAVFLNKDYESNYDTLYHLRLFRYYLSLSLTKSEKLNLSHNGSIFKLSGHISWEQLVRKTTSNIRTKILWTPHHTLDNDSPSGISSFIETKDYILTIAKKFEDIDFILKPHPLLLEYRKDSNYKYYEQINTFLKKWTSLQNCSIETGDFRILFKISDGLINDSQSFIFLYHLWDKPLLMLRKKTESYKHYFSKNGMIALELCLFADNEKEIEEFIVAIKKNILRGKRKELLFSIPELTNLLNPTVTIYDDLVEILFS